MQQVDKGQEVSIAEAGKPFRIIGGGLVRVGRWLLVLICLFAGVFTLLGGTHIGFPILLLLGGLWLILDNPLESFEILEGFCPSCGHKVKVRRRIRFSCPACRRRIIVGSERFYDEHEQNISLAPPSASEEIAERDSKIEQVVLSPGDSLDLHSFSPKEVASLLDEFIDLCQKADIRLVKIIHGKGTGMLRQRVHALLARDMRVLAFYEAPPNSGGWGATIVELRSGQDENHR